MAQSQVVEKFNADMRSVLKASNLAVAVAHASDSTLIELDVSKYERLFFHLSVTGQALDAFLIQARGHSDGTYETLFSAAADFTGPSGILVGASGNLTTLAAAASGWFMLDVRGINSVKVLASSGNAAGSTVSCYAGAQ